MNKLKAIKRESTSTGSNNKLRTEGLIPAILYGGKDPNQNISIEKKEVKNIINSDAFLTKVKTDSFDYFKFLETENRVLYSELEEGEAYLYKEQKYTGLAISFYDNGQLAFAASYKDGKLNGWWRKWEENGFLFLETEYVDGEMVSEIDFN